jgi:hypothetical protein
MAHGIPPGTKRSTGERTMATQTSKKSSTTTHKLAVIDACATEGCYEPVTKGGTHCKAHKAPAARSERAMAELSNQLVAASRLGTKALENPTKKNTRAAKAASKAVREAAAALTKANAKVLPKATRNPLDSFSAEERAAAKAKAADPVVRRELAKLIKGEQRTNAAKASRAPRKPQIDDTLGKNATEAIATLVKAGWTHKSIAAALQTSPGRVWFWAHGKTCSRISDVTALIMRNPPRADVVVAKTLKAPSAPQAAKALRLRPTDRRQLLLDLGTILNQLIRGE